MVDQQKQLTLGSGDATARTAGLMVIGAVVGLFLLKRLNGSLSISAK